MRRLATTLLLVLVAGLPAQAQEATTDPNALPDLAPREIEIRGELEISFPSLRRQPLVGFNPPPRIPELDPTRVPFTEAYRTTSADLPESPLQRPEPPSGALLEARPPGTGLVEGALGRFTSRFFRAEGVTPAGTDGTVYGRMRYQGTDGHTPFGDTTASASAFDTVEGLLGVQVQQPAWSGGVEASGFYDQYALYGAVIGNTPLTVEPTPDRTSRELGGQAWIRTAPDQAVDAELRVRYADTYVETEAFSRPDTRFERTERHLSALLTAATELPVGIGEVDVRGGLASLDPDEAFTRSLDYLDAGALLRFPYQMVDAVLGVRYLSYGADATLTGTEDVRRGYVAPTVRVSFYPADGLEVYARQQPFVEPNTLSALYRLAPYLVDEPVQRPTVHLINAEGGVQWFYGALQVAGAAGYQQSPNYRVFEHLPVTRTNGYREGVTRTSYAEARILRVQGRAAVVTRTGVEVSLTATAQRGRLTEDDTVIPYLAPLEGEVRLAFAPPEARFRAQAVGTLASARWRDRAENERVDPFVALDVEGLYRVTDVVSLLLRIESVGNEAARWSGYPRAPTVAQGGLRLNW
ncbi:MAG: TonB-dependent receptor [Bacteroidota bacterium]